MVKIKILLVCCVLLGSIRVFGGVIGPDIEACTDSSMQGWLSVAYNSIADEYLVIWEDYRNSLYTKSDIWGQIVKSDGTLRGKNFPVCTDSTDQYWPHAAHDMITNRYLVVFDDGRNDTSTSFLTPPNRDVYGVFLDPDGNKVKVPGSEADLCFPISTAPFMQWYAAIDFNPMTGNYLVVWADYRNYDFNSYVNIDIYGQLVGPSGALIAPTKLVKAGQETNFPICDEPLFDQDVPDVAWSAFTNEFFVVFAWGGIDMPYAEVYGQRVDQEGILLKEDGQPGEYPFPISAMPVLKKEQKSVNPEEKNPGFHRRTNRLMKPNDMGGGTDPVQPRVCFNNPEIGLLKSAYDYPELCECLVVWRDSRNFDPISWIFNADVYGQRVAFVPDTSSFAPALETTKSLDPLFIVTLMDSLGYLGVLPWPNNPIGNAPIFVSYGNHTCG
jgi:hypothetical protein